jgi:hypothetical protein
MTLTSPHVVQRLAPVGGSLAGRTAEMEALRRAWAAAVAGHGGMVMLAGVAGVGKSRLAAELAGEVDADGATVLVGRCPAGGAEPYHPLVEALGPLPPGHVGGREGVFGELAKAVAARAERSPVLLVLDDLHRTDRSTALAIRHVVETAARARVLVLGTYRDTAVDRAHPLVELLGCPLVERLEVEGLSVGDVTQLVGDPELGRRLWRGSAGNPVTMAELLRPGALDGRFHGFDELVARRVSELKLPARAFVEAAAVAGSEFHVDVVARAIGVRAERAMAALKQVAGAGFVVEEPSGPGGTRRFVHDMVRESVVRGLEPGRRTDLHLQVGRALGAHPERSGAPAALLAWHYRCAAPVGGSAPALGYSAQAGQRAMELLAWEEAAIHFGHALAASNGARPELRCDLLLALGEAQRLSGEKQRARQAFLEAATLAEAYKDGARLAKAALALGHVGAVWGKDAELERLAGEARAMLGEAVPPSLTAGRFTDFASDALYDVLDDVEPEPEPEPPAPAVPVEPGKGRLTGDTLHRARHVALAGPEHAAERLAAAEGIVALAASAGDDELALCGHGWRMIDALELGRADQSAADQAAHAAAARRLSGAGPAADVETWSAMRAMLEGRIEDARLAAATAFALAYEAGDPEAEDSYLTQRWWLALEWGTASELSVVADECRERANAAGGGRAWRAAAALALARGGRLDLAAEELRRVTDHGLGELLRDTGRLYPLASLAEVAWRLGDAPRAALVGPLLEPFADRLIVAGRGRVCTGSVARTCGLVAATTHHWEDAGHQLLSAQAVHRSIGALPLLARTRFEWSVVLLQRGRKGDRRRSAEWRRKSEELATRFGMTRLLEEIATSGT